MSTFFAAPLLADASGLKAYLQAQVLALMEPLGFVWGVLIVLTVALAIKRQRGFAVCTALLAIIIFVFGSTGFPGSLVQNLERPYAGVKLAELPNADAIVVLGGGSEPSRYEAGGLHLSFSGDRILMGLELARMGKAGTLVVSGSGALLDGQKRVEGDLVRDWLTQRKLVDLPVLSLGHRSDTHDEAVHIHALAREHGWKRVLLVTSAFHMRRAVAVFGSTGVEVIPVPCNFLTEISLPSAPPGIGVPRAGNLHKASIWLHEQIGWLMYRKRGWIDAAHANP